ncbi:hypothetical protein Anas_11994 [Armadillidium nasatum]|uniref:Uncharacterized protein n=1 Tax=Armadillidium nasatum TaxID=96803 RepID=A0A5N5SK67_9CRUS|nr:hypothetical protein Anas_11994 [Armadillidium nasatum]
MISLYWDIMDFVCLLILLSLGLVTNCFSYILIIFRAFALYNCNEYTYIMNETKGYLYIEN